MIDSTIEKHMQTLTIPNKFQSLIEADYIQCYAEHERVGKSIVLAQDDIRSRLLPAITSGAAAHISQRQRSITKRIGIDPLEATVEALYDSHFRKQRNFGPTRETIRDKVQRAIANKEPIILVSLMFTRKNVCTLKRNGDDIAALDLAEILSLVHLNSFAELISSFYPYGVQYVILSEGTRFSRAFSLSDDRVRLYQARLAGWIKRLDLSHLKVIDYEQFLLDRLAIEDWELRTTTYEKTLAEYKDLMEPIFSPMNMDETLEKAIGRDPIIDVHNSRNNFVPLWDSIKNSLAYPAIVATAHKRGVEYTRLYQDLFRTLFVPRADPEEEQLRMSILRESWDAAIEHNARVLSDMRVGIDVAAMLSDNAFRATINPKPDSPNLGIYSVRETTSRVQPWHGTAYLRVDSQGRLLPTVLSKLEIESRGGIPVCIDTRHDHPFFYVDSTAASLLSTEDLVFNMSTR